MNIIKKLLGIHAFLHSKTGKKYIAYIWPLIKQNFLGTRYWKYLGFAEKAYNYFESGESEDSYKAGLSLAKAEDETKYARGASKNIPEYSEISQGMDEFFHQADEQGRIGMCVPHTVFNMCKNAMRKRGLEGIEIDRSLLYKDLRLQNATPGKDTGTHVEYMFNQLIQRGIPVKVNEEIRDRKHLKNLDLNRFASNGWQTTIKLWDKISHRTSKWSRFTELCEKLDPNEYEIQISLSEHRDDYFPYETPKVSKRTPTGRHSIAVQYGYVKGEKTGVFNYKDTQATRCFESSHRTTGISHRIITEEFWDQYRGTPHGINARFIKINKTPEIVFPVQKSTEVDDSLIQELEAKIKELQRQIAEILEKR